MKMKGEVLYGRTKIHNVRFYNLEPRPISNFDFNYKQKKLALSRGVDCIEIWNLNHAAFLEKTIVVLPKSSVEALKWCEDRLFSAGLSGEISEWNLATLQRKSQKFVTGNAIWCLDINRGLTRLAAGTEEGYLNIFEVLGDELVYDKLFDKQEGRILCCKFDHSGGFIVTGSLDVIRIWNTKTGQAIHKMSTGRMAKNRETIVWSLQVLRDFTIISGDSRGQVAVWDGKLGVQLESIQALKADVLTVAVNEQENMFVCTGVDPTIRIYSLTSIVKADQKVNHWVKFLQRNLHDHDVKALVCVGNRIITGGLDGYIGISSISKMKQAYRKHGPFLQQPCVNISSSTRTILLRYWDHIEIWRLGSARARKRQEDASLKQDLEHLPLEKMPEKLLELKSINSEPIVCAAISPDGTFVVYSTPMYIRVFLFIAGRGSKTSLVRVKDTPTEFSACIKMIFSSDSQLIFLVKPANKIDVFSLAKTGEIDYVDSIDTSRIIKDNASILTTSPCSSYLIIAGTCKNISIWVKQKKNRFQHYFNLPKHSAPATAIAVHQNSPKLVAAFTDGKIYEYDIEEMRFTAFTNSMFVSNSQSHCVNSIVLDPRNDNIIILNNDMDLFVLEKCSSDKKNVQTKISKPKNADKVSDLKLKFHKTYEHFVYLAWLSKDEMVAVGVNPVSLIEQLPTTFINKKFGAS